MAIPTNDGNSNRVLVLLGSALFLALAPGIVAGLIPWWISNWKVEPPLLGFPLVRVVGILALVVGVAVLLESFARFALKGAGTPAPVAPPRHLVVTGLYRYVRNPMYLAVASIILGQSMILGNLTLLAYDGLVWLIFHFWVSVYEEPALRRTFGAEYDAFCANVPRWLPRLHPWSGPRKPQ
jgi:protein-S-isoprenylcysteine O-methyltransferase Ste14